MGQLIDRVGTFRGTILEHAVSTTKNGFPQFVVKVQATEYYDEEGQAWVPWSEYEAQITGFLVLFAEKVCLNHEQVQKAVGWDGVSYAGLNDLDLKGKVVLFRVEENTYEGKTNIQMRWIDSADADPTRTLKKLDPAALKGLDAKFAVKKAAPAKAPVKAPTPPPRATPKPAADPTPAASEPATDGPSEQSTTPPVSEPATPATSPTAPSGKPSEPPKPPARRGRPPKAKGPADGLPTVCGKDDAWAKVVELKTDACTDDMLGEAWVNAAEAVAPDIDEADITPDQWAVIRDRTLDKIPHIPF
jgi:hypothetical protein